MEVTELIKGNGNAKDNAKNKVETAELIRGNRNTKDDAENDVEAAKLVRGNRNAENDVKNKVETAKLSRGDRDTVEAVENDVKNKVETAKLSRGDRDTVEAVENKNKTVKTMSHTTQTPSGPYHGKYFYHLATGIVNQNVWQFEKTQVNLAKPKFTLGPFEKKMAIEATMPSIQL